MSIKDMLLPLTSWPEATGRGAVERAVALAGNLGAHISAMAFEMDIQSPIGLYADPVGVRGLLAADRKKSAENARALAEMFEALASKGSEKISVLREAMQHTMENGAGIYRTRASLVEAVNKIAEMQERYKTISLEDHSLAFNTQLIAALELGFLLDTAEAILQCALQREESRGAHQREDFPERDDQKFLAHSIVHKVQGGRPEVSYLPVTITRWPPGKRVYGEQSTDGGHNSH